MGLTGLPRRLLDVVDRERVRGRRASLRGGRVMVEVRAPGCADALVAAVQAVPGVRWAGVNGPLARLVAALDDPPPDIDEIVAAVERAEAGRAQRAAVPAPIDGGVERAALALAATGAGALLSGAGALLRRSPLPTEVASLIAMADTQPRVRGLLESTIGRPATDLGLAAFSAFGQGLAGGRAALAVDAAHRVSQLAEARAERAAWRAREDSLLASPQSASAEPVVVERPRRLPAGPVERWADRAALAAVGAFAAGLPLTGDPRRAVNLALATVPKAARIGREAFAAGLGRLLCRRGAVVLDPAALRLLDRVDTVVLDAEVLGTGRLLLGEVVLAPDVPEADAAQAPARLHALFRDGDPTAVRTGAGWCLAPHHGPVPQRVARARPLHVLELTCDGRPVAFAAVVAEPVDALAALAAAAHRSGLRLLVAGRPPAGGADLMPDAVLPGGARLLATVRGLQADGSVVLLVSRQRAALGNADVGVGVDTPDGRPAWGAQVLVGTDLELAALLVEGCGAATAVSRRGVRLSQAGSLLGGVGVLLGRGIGARPARTAGLAVNAAAAAALGDGTWTARRIGERPPAPPVSRVPWHAMPVEAVLERLDTSLDGLSGSQARRRLRADGVPQRAPSLLRAVVAELDNPLTPILAGGAALSAAVGSVTDAGLVAAVTGISALIGGVQRLRTDRAVAQLLASSAVTARVRRDGAVAELPAEALVPGDVVELRPGEVVPADCRVLQAAGLQADEASLTGEPFPVAKQVAPVLAAGPADRTSMLYEGTGIASGSGVAVVVATGVSTEAGRSMAATRGPAPTTGVEARLDAITNTTLPIALGSAGAVIAAGLLRGRPLAEGLGAGVSLAVASVPEGLPFLVNAAQLASARRLSGRGALVRNPRTIEALGRVDVLCFDKTGTLTEGRIALAAVDALDGPAADARALRGAHRRVLAAGLRATPRGRLAHLTDRAVAEGAAEAGVDREHRLPGWRRLAALPFEPSRGFSATLAATGDTALLSVKGAPETVLPRCTRVRGRGRPARLDERRRRALRSRVEDLAGRGYRVLAVAERTDRPDAGDRARRRLAEPEVGDLTLLGFLALSDPVRPAAAASVSALRAAGVQIVMITGDHPGTAESVARRLDVLDGGTVVTGPELDELDDAGLDALLPAVTVVARGTPAHKVRVVQAFRRLGRTVAMTGDGANDAPAIRLADVGVALGRRATPAARTAADLVVTDDRLETILAALVEGRGMWASVREALGILVGGNLGEIAFTVLGSALTGRSPLTTRQLLLVNLLTDLAPALAIALRAPDAAAGAALLAEGPEASLGAALTRDVSRRATTTAAAAAAAWAGARLTGREARARTVGLAALVGSQLGQTLAIGGRSPAVLAASLGSAAVLVGVVQTPGVSGFFGCTPLGPVGWTLAGGAATAATAATLLGRLVPASRDGLRPPHLADRACTAH